MEEMHPAQEITLGIQQLKLFSDGEEETDVVTSIDSEVGDDSDLEAEIEEADRVAGENNDDEAITDIPTL